MIHDVTRSKHAGNAGLRRVAVNAGLHLDITVFQRELVIENSGVRAVPDGDEGTGDFQRFRRVTVGIAQTNAGDAHLVAQHLIQRTVSVQHDVAASDFLVQTVNQNFF